MNACRFKETGERKVDEEMPISVQNFVCQVSLE